MKYQILPMSPVHLPRVAELEKVCFPADPWSEALFQAALDSPHTAILLAEGTDGSILGYAVLSVILDEGNLDNIAVAPDCRRQGVADALLDTLAGFGREHLSVLMLEVRASNAPAIALYKKHGFAVAGRRKNYYNAPREDAILMTLEFNHGTAAVESRGIDRSLPKRDDSGFSPCGAEAPQGHAPPDGHGSV